MLENQLKERGRGESRHLNLPKKVPLKVSWSRLYGEDHPVVPRKHRRPHHRDNLNDVSKGVYEAATINV